MLSVVLAAAAQHHGPGSVIWPHRHARDGLWRLAGVRSGDFSRAIQRDHLPRHGLHAGPGPSPWHEGHLAAHTLTCASMHVEEAVACSAASPAGAGGDGLDFPGTSVINA